MIEKLPDWRAFVNDYISDSHDKYITNIKSQKFKFYLEMMVGLLCITKSLVCMTSGCSKKVYLCGNLI